MKLVRFVTAGTDPALVRNALNLLQKQAVNTAAFAAFEYEGKPQLMVMYSADLVAAGHNAGADIREAAKFIQGGGGGAPAFAMAGGKNCAGLADAMKTLESKI